MRLGMEKYRSKNRWSLDQQPKVVPCCGSQSKAFELKIKLLDNVNVPKLTLWGIKIVMACKANTY